MSMLRGLKDGKDNIPRAATVPTPPRAITHEDYAEEAKRAAQRYLDQVAQIDNLVAEVEQWRNRALLAEGEIPRLQTRAQEIQGEWERRLAALQQQLDDVRQTLAVVSTQYASAAKILLDGFAALDGIGQLKTKITPPRVNLDQLSHTLNRHRQDDAHDSIADVAIKQIAQKFAPAEHDEKQE